MRIRIWVGLMLLMPAGGVCAGVAEDDLALVKRAVVEHERPAPSASPVEAQRPQAKRSGKEAKWLRVRIVDKKEKKATISINLPLGLVRAFGDDVKLDEGWHGHDGKRITVGDVLRTLDAGQSLVEVDDDDASVRVWIE